jgi:AraC-like DNA-binding protein
MKLEDNLRRGTEALVEISHYSRSHLARLIKQRHGTTVKRYINDLRLTEAYSMVILSSHSFEDIAFLVGFSSYSHFCKLFKGKFGLTPYGLRRQSRNIL